MAVGAAVGLGCFVSAVALPPTRHLLEKFVLPKAGEGLYTTTARTWFL